MSNEKLQALFDAALKAPEVPVAKPVGPVSKAPQESISPPSEVQEVGKASQPAVATPVPVAGRAVQPVHFEKKEADELGALLDDQMARQKRKRSLDFVITMFVLGGSLLGGIGWFVSDGQRVHAFMSAIGEIRSVSDIQSLVAKYQESLDRVAVRSDQINQATAAMGVKSSTEGLKDVHMEAEMREMMGDEGGKTVAERNSQLQKSFGEKAAEAGGAKPQEDSEELEKFKKENTFEFK